MVIIFIRSIHIDDLGEIKIALGTLGMNSWG